MRRGKENAGISKNVIAFRKSEPVIHDGATKHFAPEKGIYVMVRYLGNKKVFLILNKNDEPTSLSMDRFREMDMYGSSFKNVISGEKVDVGIELKLERRGVLILAN